MSSGTTPHLIAPRQLIATALTMTEEASIMAPRAPDLRLEVPTSIEDLEASMKLVQATTATHHAPRVVGVAAAIRRSINPGLVTFVTTSTPAQMSVFA